VTDRSVKREALLRLRQADIVGYADPGGDRRRNWAAPVPQHRRETVWDAVKAFAVLVLVCAAFYAAAFVVAAYQITVPPR
jgi:hypothetical protein